MADETPGTPPAPPPAAPPDGTPPPGPVPYDRFKEANERAKKAEEQLARIEAERKTALDKELAEQNKWRELAEQREKELNAEKLARTRQQIAMQKGIPADLVDRLQGATAEELSADADRLLQFLKPATGPGVPPPPKITQPSDVDISKMTAAQIRKLMVQE